MNKLKLKIFSSLMTGMILVPSIAFTTTFLITNKNKKIQSNLMTDYDWNNNSPFTFNSKNYLSLNDALNDLLDEIGGIKTEQFVGEINKIESNGLIDIASNSLYEYDLKKLSHAYQDANGRLTNNYDKALESFINVANLVPMFFDYKGNYFVDEQDAKNSMGIFQSMGLTYYEIQDINGQMIKINPLNKQDQLKLKEIAIAYLQNDSSNNSPFKLIAIEKQSSNIKSSQNNDSYHQSDIYINETNGYKTILNKVIEKIRDKLIDKLLEYISENKVIKTRIYIKPYSLNRDDLRQYEKPYSYWILDWKFSNDKHYIDSRPLNLSEYQRLLDIFTNRNIFDDYYDFKYDRDHGWGANAGFRPMYEYAQLKNNSNAKFLQDCFINQSININKQKTYVHPNSENSANRMVYARILSSSDKYTAGLGPDYKTNNTLSFGVVPFIDDDNITDSSNNRENTIKDINDYLINSIKDSDTQRNLIIETINEIERESAFSKNNDSTSILKIIKTLKASYSDPLEYFKVKDEKSNQYINIFSYLIQSVNNEKKKVNLLCKEIKDRSASNSGLNKQAVPYFNNEIKNNLGISTHDNLDYNLYDSIDYVYLNYAQELKDNNKNLLSTLIKDNSVEDWNLALASFGYYEKGSYNGKNRNNMLSNFSGIDLSSILDKIKIDNNNNIIDTSLNIFTKKAASTFDYFITYNNMPLYQLNENIMFNQNIVNFNRDIDFEKYLHAIYYKQLDNLNDIININSSSDVELLDQLLINVSNRLNFDTNKDNLIFSDYYFSETKSKNDPILKITNNKLTLKNNNLYKPTSIHLPENIVNKNILTGIKAIVDIYNYGYERLKLNSSSGNHSILEQKQINNKNINNIVVLYDSIKNNNQVSFKFKNLCYAEVIESASNLNLSLSNPDNKNLFATNLKELSDVKARLSVFKNPAKMYLVYVGPNLINIPSSSNIDTSGNPGFIDSPELVLQNAMRSYKLLPNTDYVMYNIENDSYVALRNNVFNLYSILLNNNKYYFYNSNYALQELTNYIKMNSYKR